MQGDGESFPAAPSKNLDVVLDDLCVRFILNLPEEDFESFERLFFSVESARWFYIDFFQPCDPTLPHMSLKQFATKIFGHTALLKDYVGDVDTLVSDFQAYKRKIPSNGAALLNHAMDRVLMVRSWGRNGRWGFPKGKISKNETELDCAIREVFEEIGYDITPLVSSDTFYVDFLSSERRDRIFVVTGVPDDYEFRTRTRKEISDIKWLPLSALPETEMDAQSAKRVQVMCTGPSRAVRYENIVFSYLTTRYTEKIRCWVENERRSPALVTGNVADAPFQNSSVDMPRANSENTVANLYTEGAISEQELESSLLSTKPGL